jgi:hypothetical protein
LYKPEARKTNDIENCSSFLVSNTSLVLYRSNTLVNFLFVSFLLKCF